MLPRRLRQEGCRASVLCCSVGVDTIASGRRVWPISGSTSFVVVGHTAQHTMHASPHDGRTCYDSHDSSMRPDVSVKSLKSRMPCCRATHFSTQGVKLFLPDTLAALAGVKLHGSGLDACSSTLGKPVPLGRFLCRSQLLIAQDVPQSCISEPKRPATYWHAAPTAVYSVMPLRCRPRGQNVSCIEAKQVPCLPGLVVISGATTASIRTRDMSFFDACIATEQLA